jgi:tripartite-type tricarboxylate transporter receptor subunit TctC
MGNRDRLRERSASEPAPSWSGWTRRQHEETRVDADARRQHGRWRCLACAGPGAQTGRLSCQAPAHRGALPAGRPGRCPGAAAGQAAAGRASNVLAAPADGHTLLLANEAGLSLAPAVAPYLKVDVPYDPARDFAGVSVLAQYGSILSVPPNLPVKSLPEFIAYAKKNPGKINYASFGNGSQPHIMMELLSRQAGIETVHIAYKGAAPATLDLVAARVQAMISAPAAPMPFILDGRLRAIAYSGTRRLAQLPEVPTFAEGQLPGYEARGWFGVVMHSGTPAPIRAWLSDVIWSVVQSAEYQQTAIARNGLEAPSLDPSKIDAFLSEDRARWKGTVQQVRDRLA